MFFIARSRCRASPAPTRRRRACCRAGLRAAGAVRLAASSRSASASSTRCSASSTWTTRPTSAPASRRRWSRATRRGNRSARSSSTAYSSRRSGRRSASTSRPPTAAASSSRCRCPTISLTGMPVGSGRLGYELNLPRFQVKLGGCGVYGLRNDQTDRRVLQRVLGGDLRVAVVGLYLNAEYVRVDEDEGTTRRPPASAFSRCRRSSTSAASTGSSPTGWRSTRVRCTRSRSTGATSGVTPGSRASRRSPSIASRPACASICGSR